MGRFIICRPLSPVQVTASRGSAVANLLTPEPKEVWTDAGTGSAVLTIDLGAALPIDTIFLGYVSSAIAGTTWAITGGLAGASEFPVQATAPLRVPDVAGDVARRSHALCYLAAPVTVRYLAVTTTQPAGAAPLSIGVLVAGRAFASSKGQEWGAGRQPIDTGSATPLSSGGFAVVEGAIKRLFGWTFGDLSAAEAEELEVIGLARGETRPVLVVEDVDRTAGMIARIHYGLFRRWSRSERRNRAQTRWELAIEQWL